MQVGDTNPITQLSERFWASLPALTNGLLVLAAGLLVAWVVKRSVVRALVWLRLDRLAGSSGWRAAFGKGDVRAAAYGAVGTVTGAVVFLYFLDNALQIWGLTVLFRLMDTIVFFLPNLLTVAVILGVGILIANVVAGRVEAVLEEEEVAHPRLLARTVKALLLTVVGALALWQLRLGREIVLGAFLLGFGALAVSFVLAVGLGSAKAVERVWTTLLDRAQDGD